MGKRYDYECIIHFAHIIGENPHEKLFFLFVESQLVELLVPSGSSSGVIGPGIS